MKTKLNRKLSVSLIILFSFPGLFAQPSNLSLLKTGTKHGIISSRISFDPPVTQDLTLGYNGGLVVQYLSEKHAGIQAEINFSQRGWTEKLDSSNSYKRILNYIEVPVLTHLYYTKNKTTYFINLGPDLSFHVSDRESFHLTHPGDTLPYYLRKLDRNFELALTGGIGIGRITSIGDFQLEARFHYGLQNIFSSGVQTDLDKSQNILYGVSLSYFFIRKNFKPAREK